MKQKKELPFMRTPKGVINNISKHSQLSESLITNYINRCAHPSRNRAKELELACKKAGFHIPKELWIFGTKEQIKACFIQKYNYT
jgi:hypothetical protein